MWLAVVCMEGNFSQIQSHFIPSLEICGVREHLDAFPQSVFNGSTRILCSIAIICALAGLYISSTSHALY